LFLNVAHRSSSSVQPTVLTVGKEIGTLSEPFQWFFKGKTLKWFDVFFYRLPTVNTVSEKKSF
jgi:hypothetical protein